MSSAEYQVLAKIILEDSNVQGQLNKIGKKAKITMVANLDEKSLEGVITRWQNKIKKLEFTKPEIFADKDVQREINNFKGMISEFQAGNVTMQQVNTQWDNVAVATAKAGQAFRNTQKDGYGMTQMLEIAIKKVILWGAATTIIYGLQKEINKGIQYIKDLNKEMVNIQVVNNMTTEQIADLSMQYNNLAKQLGTTTLEVAKGSLEWIRQGKSVAETNILLRDSTMMSKLANLDAAQSTEYLTSILNGFKLEAKDASGVIDKLVGLDNSYASSVGKYNCRNVW